jgi:hypothetical protein
MALFRQRVLLATTIAAATSGMFLSVEAARGDGPGHANGYYDAIDPVGARQRCKHDRLWPPFPRPTGEKMEFWHAYHAAHYWPWPYTCFDRASIRDFSEIQVANGWITEATLYDYHFDPDTQLLNQSGELHLQWILHSVPPDRRAAWVQASLDPAVSQQRLANVRNQAIAMVGEGNTPPVMLRIDTPYGRPAGEIDQLRRIWSDPRVAPSWPKIQYTVPTLGTN